MNSADWTYQIFIHGEKVNETNLSGIAYMMFGSAKLIGLAELHRVYVGTNFDPVLHYTTVERGGIYPPCCEDKNQCRYRQSLASEYYVPRPTAFRIETMCPQDTCGFMLKPSRLGGRSDDYAPCIGGHRK
jgi:hypothetical protein